LRRPKLGLNVAVVLAAAGTFALLLQEAFTAPGASRAATSRPVRARSVAGSARHGPTARRAEASFDPFGWKGALKDTVEGLMDGMQGDDPPSKFEEAMIVEIFQKFDLDKDGVLDLEEFNTLQVTTEGPEAVYDLDQLKQLLEAVDSDHPEPEKGMPFAVYRRLYAEGRLRRAYNTDVQRDYEKIFGQGGGAAAASSALQEGAQVVVDGLAGAVELNGQTGEIVAPLDSEVEMVKEGRVIVKLADGERVALRIANVKAAA